MRLIELMLTAAIAFAVLAIAATVWPQAPAATAATNHPETPVAEPIKRGNAQADGNGVPWTHGLDGKPLTNPEVSGGKVRVAYRGFPFGL